MSMPTFLVSQEPLCSKDPEEFQVPRKAAVARFRLFKGHYCMRFNIYRIGITNSPDCSVCNSGQPITSGYFNVCPSLREVLQLFDVLRLYAKLNGGHLTFLSSKYKQIPGARGLPESEMKVHPEMKTKLFLENTFRRITA
ncbi:hypothetical protein TNCV_234371 [Trichonephila clavipes]|uniref:Uncharacterized protein n=1 Tax=Trichonephila clavipes TaxID=2585209 RepID=A0A8X6VDY4_TRICX|nr:hypothetical protein TNCV_234371 [Trichonephila clavipes]